MKVLLVGATFNSNFGDLLFSHLFYNKCKEVGFEKVSFWQSPRHVMCDFCREELGYHECISPRQAIRHDALILLSGGMMGEPYYSRRTTLLRFVRFVLPCLMFTLLRKPVYVLGSGGSPIYSGWLRKMMVYVLNHARYISVRNQETRDYYVEHGVRNEIHVTSDTAQVITPQCLPPLHIGQALTDFMANHRTILLQMSYSRNVDPIVARRIVPAIKRFLNDHPDYRVVFATDKVTPKEWINGMETVNGLPADRLMLYEYRSSWQLAALINRMDMVMTTTLHVGIVGASLGKSVLSFAAFYDKTRRYYKQIHEEGRCVPMREVTPDIAYNMLCRYYAEPITLDASIRQMAASNLNVIEQIAHITKNKS